MNLLNKILRCTHRHTIDEHPACFHAGNINQENAMEVYEENGKPWYQVDGYKIGYLDIETDGLKADWNTMLTWCLKEKDGPTAYDVITREELIDGDGDKRIVSSLVDEMLKYKIIVTYYGTGFDIPFTRTRAMYHGLYFPSYVNELYENKSGNTIVKSVPELLHFDLYYMVKSKMCLASNKLENATQFLGIEGKTPISKNDWRRAKYGDPDALAEVLRHNVGDVEILEALHDRLEPFAKWLKKPL